MSWYIAKCKYTFEIIEIIAKLDEIFNHILNMNWLYNYNWKFWFMWFHKKRYGQIFHSNGHKCVEKKHVVERQKLFWKPFYQNPFYMFIKMLNEKENSPKICPKTEYIFLPKMAPYSVFSPYKSFKSILKYIFIFGMMWCTIFLCKYCLTSHYMKTCSFFAIWTFGFWPTKMCKNIVKIFHNNGMVEVQTWCTLKII